MLLYLHIPFCDSKCHYCSFNSYVDKFAYRKRYMQALMQQLKHDIDFYQVTEGSIETLFIGGGTPSTIEPALYQELFSFIHPYLHVNAEITSEANPNSATYEWIEGMKQLGVNRLSFGVQSFNNEKLKLLGRAHNATMAIDAIKNAHTLGFNDISLDLIYGVAGDTLKLLQDDLSQALSLPINHLSAYALTIEENTLFEKKPHMSHEQLPHTKEIFHTIIAAGLKQYEISNFGKPSEHNRGYWLYKEYLGVGCGAIGRIGENRLYTQKDIDKYLQDPLQIEKEPLSSEDIMTEKLFLGLRSNVGFDSNLLSKSEKKQADILVKEEKLYCIHNRYYNSDYLLSDELALFILA